jgi:hypothetical protein
MNTESEKFLGISDIPPAVTTGDRIKRINRAAMLITLMCLGLLIVWAASYRAYGILAYEAYSGVGTEFMSSRGQAIFYSYSNYETSLPPQNWSLGLIKPDSNMGERIRDEFDFSRSLHWWERIGLCFIYSNSFFSEHSSMIILSMPYWFIELILLLLMLLLVRHKRRLLSLNIIA